MPYYLFITLLISYLFVQFNINTFFRWLNAVWDIHDLEIKYNLYTEQNRINSLAMSLFKFLPNNAERFLLAHTSAGL